MVDFFLESCFMFVFVVVVVVLKIRADSNFLSSLFFFFFLLPGATKKMEEDYDVDADYAWRVNVPLVQGHICSMDCDIKTVDKEKNVYGCLIGGILHYCNGNDCDRMIVTEEGQICLWSGKELHSNYDTSTGFQYIKSTSGHVMSNVESSYRSIKNSPAAGGAGGGGSNKKKKKQQERRKFDPLKGVKPLKIRKIPKTPTPIKKTEEELKMINQQKALLKRKTDIVTALEYLVWNDEVRNSINNHKKEQFSEEMCKFTLKFVKNNKCLPLKDIIDEQYMHIKRNHQFLPLIGLSSEELTVKKNQIAETVMKQYELLVLHSEGKSSLRVLHFALGYLMLMIEGIKYKNFEIPRDEFMSKYHIDHKFLNATDAQFSVESEHKKKPQIPNIKKDTIGNASKDIKQLLMNIYH